MKRYFKMGTIEILRFETAVYAIIEYLKKLLRQIFVQLQKHFFLEAKVFIIL